MALIKVRSPRLPFAPRVIQRQEPMRVQALFPEPTAEGLNKRIVCGLPGARELQRHLVHISSLVERPGEKLRAIVHPELGWRRPTLERQALHHCCNRFALYALICMDRQVFPGKCVHHREGPKVLPIEQSIRHKIHRPDFFDPFA
jgi:hypothetical protein